MRLNVATTVDLLGVIGIPAIQHGNVIEIATGRVGIDEACSGIRSFQAALMLSLFFGELYRLTVRRRVWLVLLSFALAFLFNVGRTLLLTHVASTNGVGAVASWHDPAGITILVACFLSVWLLALWLKRGTRVSPISSGVAQTSSPASFANLPAVKSPDFRTPSSKLDVQGSMSNLPPARSSSLSAGGEGRGEVAPPSSDLPPPPSLVQGSKFDVPSTRLHPPSSLFHLRWVSVGLLAWLILVESGTAFWYRSHEHRAAGTTEWSVNLDAAGPAVTKVVIPPNIRSQFKADQSLQGRWQDPSGNAWQLYYFRWRTADSLKGRVAIQMAKVHGPEICLPAAGMGLESYLGVITVRLGKMELALQQYFFTAGGRPIHIFYGIYEDPTGGAVLANRRQNTTSRIKAALAGSRNYGQRFLEVAVSGYEKPEDAKAALVDELGKLIKIEQPTAH